MFVKKIADSYETYTNRKNRKILISVVVPCYNEESGIALTVQTLDKELPDDIQHTFEFILVDDASTDTTPQVLLELCNQVSRLKVLRLSQNVGSHIGVRAGMEYSSGDVVVFLTADLQENPTLLKKTIHKWREGADVVCSVAEYRDRGWFFSNLFANILYLILYLSPILKHVKDKRAITRLLDRKVVDFYCEYAPCMHNQSLWILQQRFLTDYVYYTPEIRRFGQSKWTLRKKIHLAINTLMDVSPYMLTIWLRIGFFILLFAPLIGLVNTLATPNSQVFFNAFNIFSILFFAGIHFIALGFFGAYLLRIYNELRTGKEYSVLWSKNFESNLDKESIQIG